LINIRFDQMFLEKIETDPTSLAALSREQYVEEAGSEGIELIMWLIMRGALGDGLTRIHDTYHVPASNTAAALALFSAPEVEQAVLC
jgi:protocatechuate 4,5-dioxygenase beta chain